MKTVNINVKKAGNGYVLAVDFDRFYESFVTVHKDRDELDTAIYKVINDLDKNEDEV